MTENKKIYHKLVDGFKTIYNLDFEKVKNEYNKTGGLGKSSDEKRFIVHFGDKKFPEKCNKCVCGHKIQNNCYISKIPIHCQNLSLQQYHFVLLQSNCVKVRG